MLLYSIRGVTTTCFYLFTTDESTYVIPRAWDEHKYYRQNPEQLKRDFSFIHWPESFSRVRHLCGEA
jgi:hypothetical protein